MECNKCGSNCTCQDNTCPSVDAKCVIYKPDGISMLNCLDEISAGTSIEKLLEAWDLKFCEMNFISILPCVKTTLDIPVDVTTLTTSAFLNSIQNWICNQQDIKVKVSPADATSGYLYDKVDTGECLLKTVVIDEDNNQKVKISIDYPCLIQKIPTCFNITPTTCITVDNSNLPCNPQPTYPTVTRVGSTLKGSNCNGTLQWYNINDVLIGTGNSLEVPANQYYYAKCVTACGESAKSDGIQLPPINTYTATRTAIFTRNNCGVNTCNIPCTSSSVVFTKTYTSTTSQEVANSMAENDLGFSVEGQSYANINGTCLCPDCSCVFPTYNSNIVVNNATCNGNIIVANGQITIANIANANRFGWSIGPGSYNGIGYDNAITLNNFNQGNIETTPTSIKLKGLSIETRITIRIFNSGSTCFRDVVVNLTPPDCSQEQIVIDDVDISCGVDEQVCKNWTVVVGNTTSNMWYRNCQTGVYTFTTINSNSTVQICSTLEPQATGAVVTENGTC